MAFPAATVASPDELPAFTFDGSAVEAGSTLAGTVDDAEVGGAAAEAAFDGSAFASGFALACAGDDDPGDGAAAAEAAEVPPRLAK
jgi:hypothetical protein